MLQFPDRADGLERRRLGLFVVFAFGIAWAVAAVLYANGGLTDSPPSSSRARSHCRSRPCCSRPPTCSRPVSRTS